MLLAYLFGQFQKAKYELIDGGKRYYGEIPGIRGAWATGHTLEECRANLLEVLEGWVSLRLKKNLPLPGLKAMRRQKKIAVYV